MDKKISNAKQAWKMNQVILAMNNEDAYYGSGWLYVWPDGSDYSECLEYFSDDESFKELRTLYRDVFKDYYKDGLYNPEKVGPDALEFANETLRKLKISGEFKETQPKLWTVAGDESTQEAMTEAVKKEPKHLKELISKLNKPVEFEDEVFEPIFNFTLEQRDGQWFLYDSNEQYTINYEEDQMYFYQQVADEFGAKIPDVSDDIFPQLEQAIKADFGDDAYFEWEDSVTMVVVPGMKESEHNHTMKENKLIEAQEKIELTSDIINALYDEGVDFQEAEDENGNVFLIVYGWDTIKQMQQIIKPDFVPEDEYDTSVIDNLKDVEWGFADEWSRCDECGKVIRTQPDSYSFVPDYWVNDSEILCGDCVRNNHAEEYAQSLINKERLANTILTDDNLEELGFIRIESDFESGWYDRNDSPKEILKTALDKHPNGEFLFSISGQAQFATQFELWAREESLEDDDLDESKKLKEGKQLNEMVVDLILDRKDGLEYDPEQFYRDAMQYGEVADEITRALDSGTEADVKKALCKYIKDNKYNPSICDYINSVSWIEQFDESMKKSKNEELIEPKKGEKEQAYVSRFMGTKLAEKDFPNQKQRLAVAYSKFKNRKSKKNESMTSLSKDKESSNDRQFKLSNTKTTTWMQYYQEVEGTDEEGVLALYDMPNWNGICQYIADVVLNGKKLFRVGCFLFEGIGSWTEYHIDNDTITPLGREYLESSGLIANEDNDEVILDIDSTHYDDESTVEKMLQPVIERLSGAKLTEDANSSSEDIQVYQFPSSIENFLPEFERLCDEFGLNFLGKGHGNGQDKDDEPDLFVEGSLKDLEALAKEIDYELHPDYLSPADEFAYDDILINESIKVYIKEATQKQIDAKRKELYAKEKSVMTDSDKIEYVENSARNMMVSILVYGAKPDDSDESFNKLFEREIKNRYLGNFLKADNFGNPAISKERIKELWNEMVTDFKKAEVGYAGEDSEGLSYNYVRFADESLTKKTIKESVDKKFSEEEANKFVKELTQKFFDEGEYFDIWSSAGVIEAQIEWGDWKHQHLFFKKTVQKFFNDLNIDIDIDSQVTEEDGSDTYSASYKITKI